jgi:hypothetical protein
MRAMFCILLAAGCGGEGKEASEAGVADSAAERPPVTVNDTGPDAEPAETAEPSDTGDAEAVMVSVALDVLEKTLTATADTTEQYRFRFIATYSDGRTERIGEGVEWVLDNPHIGSLDGRGLFVTSTTQGGKATIAGQVDGLWATAELTVKYVGSIVPGGFDLSVFSAPEVPESGTGMIYPADGVMIPKNQPAIHFQWEDLGGISYRLRFDSPVTELSIYSTDLSWISDAELWPVIGRSNAGMEVRSTLSVYMGTTVVVKESQSISIQDLEATGSIIYWTPTAQGLMRIPYGEEAESFLTVTETGHCVGCHAVSSAGMVAFVYDSSSSPLGMKTMDTLEDRIPYDSGYRANYKAFSPDGSLLLTNLDSQLNLFNGITGEYISSPVIEGASWVSNIEWAPDDSFLVFIDTPSASADLYFTSGTLKRATHLGGGTFGPSETIISVADLDPSYGFTNIYYPAVSPDSRWVMFNASTGDSYDDPDATLFVVPIDGGTPIELSQANITPGQGNSLPKWAPATSGDDYWWFAFASRRAYGGVSSGIAQIWLSSFDPGLAAAGMDPSSEAIWLSNQDPAQSNHIPLWVD